VRQNARIPGTLATGTGPLSLAAAVGRQLREELEPAQRWRRRFDEGVGDWRPALEGLCDQLIAAGADAKERQQILEMLALVMVPAFRKEPQSLLGSVMRGASFATLSALLDFLLQPDRDREPVTDAVAQSQVTQGE